MISEINKYKKMEDNYPFLIANLMEYIDTIKKKECVRECSLIDIIMDYSFRNSIDVELVGDAIRSDVYFKSFVEKDCEIHGIIKTQKPIQVLEEW